MAGPFLPLPPNVVVALVAVEGRAASHSLARSAALHRKHLQQGIENDHLRVKKNMSRIGGFQSFYTAKRTIRGVRSHAVAAQRLRFLGHLDGMRAEPAARVLFPTFAGSQSMRLRSAQSI